MSATENKRLIRQAAEEFNDRSRLDTYMTRHSEDCVIHGLPTGEVRGRNALRDFYGMFLTAFPDAQVKIDDLIADDNKVVMRCVMHGSHQGEFMGIPASRKPIAVKVISIFEIDDGQIVERRAVLDALGMLQQIGAIPATEPAAV